MCIARTCITACRAAGTITFLRRIADIGGDGLRISGQTS